MDEYAVTSCKERVAEIRNVLSTKPSEWGGYVSTARSVISYLDGTGFMTQPERVAEQIYIVEGLQDLAYHSQESGQTSDIASWCTAQWLSMLERHPNNVAALGGLAQNWLSKAQPALARINRLEASSSSSSGGAASFRSLQSLTASEEEAQNAEATREAEQRMSTPDYVEARGILVPATEYFSRAVDAAVSQNVLRGELLVGAADAYINLGAVTSIRYSERHFRSALDYLKTASRIRGFTLPPYFQRYLDDYGRLLD